MAEEENVHDDPTVEVEEEEIEEEEAPATPESEAEVDPYEGLTETELKERLAKAEKAIVKHKKPTQSKELKAPITKQPKGDEIPEWGQKIIQSEEKREFGYEHQLSPEQVDAVFRYNGGKKPGNEFLERPEVKAIIKTLGAKDRVAANTPKGGTGVVYKNKTFDEIMTDPGASKADKQGAFEAARKKHGIG